MPQALQETLDTGNISDNYIELDDGNNDFLDISTNAINGRYENQSLVSFDLSKGQNTFVNLYGNTLDIVQSEQVSQGFNFYYQSYKISLQAVNYLNDPVIELPDNIDSKLEIQNTNFGGTISTETHDVVIDNAESTIYNIGEGDIDENAYSYFLNFDEGLTFYFLFGADAGIYQQHFVSDIGTIVGTEFYAGKRGLLIVTRVGTNYYMSETLA
jgi:hypothetical protein